MKKGYDLGKGISALFENIKAEDLERNSKEGARDIPIQNIVVNPHQPRKTFKDADLMELTNSIKKHGVVQPIVVRPVEDKYEIVAGERRYRASQRCGLSTIPAVVRQFSADESFTIAVIENVQRSNLNPIEEAEAFAVLCNQQKLTQEGLAHHLGKTRSYIANALRLLALPESVQKLLRDGTLSPGHAKVLVGQKNAEELARNAVKEKLSVRAVEAMVKSSGGEEERDIVSLEKSLSAILKLKTRIFLSKKGGRVEVSFKDFEELENFVSRLYDNK